MDFSHIITIAEATLTTVGLKVLGAIVIYVVGRWLINFVVDLVRKGLTRQHFDPHAIALLWQYAGRHLEPDSGLAILGYFGVETTSFAALLAGARLAIGAAWSGLLANFAAGIFLIVLRPFKVGDFISGGGITGTVEEIGLFVTTINTPDNVRTFVGNNKLFADNIQNFSANPYRRVELTAQISDAANPQLVISAIKDRLAKIPNVLATPAPDCEIHAFTGVGPVLAVRPYCSNDNYWQVYFDTNMALREVLGSGAFPGPMPVYGIKQMGAAAATAA